MDGLDRASVGDALAGTQPEVVIHQLTAFATMGILKKFDEEFAETNRLRTTGTDHLLAASRAAGVKRFIAQSYTGWLRCRRGARGSAPASLTPGLPLDGSR